MSRGARPQGGGACIPWGVLIQTGSTQSRLWRGARHKGDPNSHRDGVTQPHHNMMGGTTTRSRGPHRGRAVTQKEELPSHTVGKGTQPKSGGAYSGGHEPKQGPHPTHGGYTTQGGQAYRGKYEPKWGPHSHWRGCGLKGGLRPHKEGCTPRIIGAQDPKGILPPGPPHCDTGGGRARQATPPRLKGRDPSGSRRGAPPGGGVASAEGGVPTGATGGGVAPLPLTERNGGGGGVREKAGASPATWPRPFPHAPHGARSARPPAPHRARARRREAEPPLPAEPGGAGGTYPKPWRRR